MCMTFKTEGKRLEHAFLLLTREYEILYKIDEERWIEK